MCGQYAAHSSEEWHARVTAEIDADDGARLNLASRVVAVAVLALLRAPM
jgi:hypothetical protein